MQSKSTRASAQWLAVILFIGVSARLASAFFQGDVVEPLPGIHDQVSYDLLARRVLDGFGFTFASNHWPATKGGEPTAHWSYLYTLYLSAVYGFFGAHPLAARLIQAIIAGLLQPWLTWRLASRVFDHRVALVAASMSAVYVYFVYYGGALMTEAFFIVAVLWSLDLSAQIAERGGASKRGWVLLGLAVGSAVLLRQVFLLFVPFLLGWLVRRAAPREPQLRHGLRSLGAGVFLTSAVLACLVLPWTVRNYLAFERFALLNSNAGFAFFWANHPIHGNQFTPILSGPGPTYGDLIPPSTVGLNEVALDQELLRRGLRFIGDEPVRYLRLSASRAEEYFKFWPSSDSSRLSNLARVGSFGVLLPFVLVGLVVSASSTGAWRDQPRQGTAGLLYLFIIVYTLVHLLSWSLVRYRLPVDAILVIFASNGVLYLAKQLGAFSERRLQPAS